MTPTRTAPIDAAHVHEVLGLVLLADGYDLVLDLEKSHGRRMYDAKGDRWYLDMFSCFATLPLGLNHPKMKQPEFLAQLQRAALTNPSNSDVYTVEFAEFVDAFRRLAMPDYLPHLFVIAGGALGVENALKAAFDWKVRRNFRNGLKEEKGHQVLHFREAFHGRTGYTLSLTNTADPRKDDIACVILEPIQAEGGDNHFRPEFLRALRDVTHENDALLIFDEVQTGMGITGRMWMHQHHDVRPDLLSFGKKTQVCGMMGGGRIDEEPENVFKVSSRINSTWGGNLVDMVRCRRYLEIMHEERLVENAATLGKHLLARLEALQAERPEVLSNARGRGLMCAIDFPDGAVRDAAAEKAYDLGMIILPCGTHSLRFRPPLDVTAEELDEAVDLLRRAVDAATAKSA